MNNTCIPTNQNYINFILQSEGFKKRCCFIYLTKFCSNQFKIPSSYTINLRVRNP